MDKYNSWIGKLVGKFNSSDNFAITIGQTTYYSSDEQYVKTRPNWQRHEDCHKRQWAKYGRIRFAVLYLYYSARYGYWNNPFEVEARAAEIN